MRFGGPARGGAAPPAAGAALPAAAELTDAEFASALAAIRPAADEDRYTQIPWRTSLWAARREAAAAGKPILLWEMDGHPLGCG